jgi:uncharacterized protein (DUF2267 family)
MSSRDVGAVDRSIEKTNEWLNQLSSELGKPDDRRYAFRVLRAFLHTLRDRLPVNESADLAAQLPVLLRGVYFDGWRPSKVPHKYHDIASFLDELAREAGLTGRTEAAYAAEATARVLGRHVSDGELRDVRAALPAGIGDLLTASGTS